MAEFKEMLENVMTGPVFPLGDHWNSIDHAISIAEDGVTKFDKAVKSTPHLSVKTKKRVLANTKLIQRKVDEIQVLLDQVNDTMY